MASKYQLQPNEVVVLKEEGVMHGGAFASYTDELLLTNLNLVLMKKGIWGNSKDVRLFPVSEIKVHAGQAQAVVGKSGNRSDVLDVYFLNGQEQFGFRSGGKKRLNEWVAKINQVVTGQETANSSPGMALPGAEMVAGVLKDTIGVFKNKWGSSAGQTATTVATKCRACGAPVSGMQGQSVDCAYCGSAQQL